MLRHSILAVASGALFITANVLAGPPSQLPLLTRDASGPTPNLVFTLDDSGSMNMAGMGNYGLSRTVEADGAGGFSQICTNYCMQMGYAVEESLDPSYSKWRTISTRDGDLYSARWRNTQFNTIYYNPAVRYQPWANGDGTNMPDAPIAAAPLDPTNLTDGTANLEGIQSLSGNFCYTNPPPALDEGICEAQTAEEHAPATYYVFNGGDQMDVANYTRVRIADLTTFSAGEARTDCPADLADPSIRLCTQAEEYQNFANWFTYYRNRYLMAIGATSLAFAPLGDSMRVGYGRINNFVSNAIDGVSTQTIERGVRSFGGVERTDFFDWLKLHGGQGASGGTPLRKAMDDVGKYFERSDDDGPWGHDPGTGDATDHLACRKSYHILMTDGGWNSDPASGAADSNVDGTAGPTITGPGGQSYSYTPGPPFSDANGSMLADVAMYYWNRDLRPDLENDVAPDPDNPAFWQHVVQFTIGLGVFGSLNPETDLPDLVSGAKSWSNNTLDDLWHAAVNSRGKYLSATSPAQIAEGLAETLATIAARESSEAGSSVSTVSLEAGNRKFIPSYRTGNWSGDVQALELDATGLPIATLWRASEQIDPDFTQRPIYVGTGLNTGAVAFDWNVMPAGLQAQMGPTADEAMVNYLRGDRTFEGSSFRTRDPDSLIGDIVNSTPALIGGLLNEQYQFLPDSASERQTYRAFLDQKKARPQVLFVGSNDGMLHGFDGDTGAEVFSFIPNAVLPNMYKLSEPGYTHQMMVDGPLSEGDAYVGGAWRNYLLGTLGAGGKSVFAVDVTDTASLDENSVQWEYTDTELGYVMQPLAVGKMMDGTWAAVFGNGVESTSGTAKLYIIDIETGGTYLERIITVPVAGGNGLGGVRLVKNVNNEVVAAYAGDLKGNLWRFDLQDTNSGNWTVGFGGIKPLYTTAGGANQAITTAPEYVLHPDGGQLVIFGTGRLYEESDLGTTDQQSLFGIWDKVDGATASGANLAFNAGETIVTQSFGTATVAGSGSRFWSSSSTPVDYSVHRGWELPLTLATGQRVVFPPQLIRGFAFFNTISTGGEASACKPTGSNGYNILVNALFGANSSKQILDTNGDGAIDEGDQLVSAYETKADGVNRILTGREGAASIQGGTTQQNARLRGRDLTRYWRQIINPPF